MNKRKREANMDGELTSRSGIFMHYLDERRGNSARLLAGSSPEAGGCTPAVSEYIFVIPRTPILHRLARHQSLKLRYSWL